jgi:hypothetical protein
VDKNINCLILITCLVCFSNNISAHPGPGVIHDCTIGADILIVTGEVVKGTGSDLAGVEMVDWMFDAPGLAFETVAADPGGVICNENGSTSVTIPSVTLDGFGTAMVNGTPGYSYQIAMHDNQEHQPEDSIRLCSALVQSPRTRIEGSSTFAMPRLAIIPDELPLAITAGGVVGQAGKGKARLELDRIRCNYRGTETPGEGYAFERCTGPTGHEYMPGDGIAVSEVSLRIQSADRSEPVTSVLVELGMSTPVGLIPDTYTFIIADPSGGFFYSFSSDVICGDIEINLIH